MSVKAEINVTPLVDVVLVLLIIFMVVAPQLESGATVTLPTASNPDRSDAPGSLQPLTVSLTKDGVLFFDKEKLGEEQLKARLEDTHRQNPEQKVVLKADQAAEYGTVRALFKLCQGIGFPGVSLQVIDRANQATREGA